jgi:thioredoxin reductase (NADPH)
MAIDRGATLIVASGASARWMGLASEQKLIGHGVSSRDLRRVLYRGKKIGLSGRGYRHGRGAFRPGLAARWRSGTGERIRASKIMLERVRSHEKIKLITPAVVEEVFDLEKGYVTAVRLRNVETGETGEREVDGLLVAIGHIPNTGPFRGQLN